MNALVNTINSVKWNARATIEGRKIAKRIAAEENISATEAQPDRCSLDVKTNVLTFTWNDDAREPVIIDTYKK